MLRKICFGISLILSIAMCLSFLIYPVMEFERDSVEKHNPVAINAYIESYEGEASEEELIQEAINSIIDGTTAYLQIHGNVGEFVEDENGKWVNKGIDIELREQELERIRTKGIKYRDLANGIKNQCTYDIKVYNIVKNIEDATNSQKSAAFFEMWINPFPFIGIVLLISLEFASALLVAIRSIKGMIGKKKTKLLPIAIFGCLMSLFLLRLPKFYGNEMDVSNHTAEFIFNIKGTGVVYYSFFAFIACIVIAILTKIFKPE